MTETLSHVLEDLSSGRKDSSGHFTINLKHATEKFRVQAERQPWAWLLLLVQAGAQIGAARIEIELSQSRQSLQMTLARSLPPSFQAGELFQELGSGNGEPGVREAQSALLRSLCLSPRELRFTAESASGAFWAKWTEGTLTSGAGPGTAESIRVELDLESKTVRLATARQAIQERLTLCPVPVFLNGWQVSTGSLDPTIAMPKRGALLYQRYVLTTPEAAQRLGACSPGRTPARYYRLLTNPDGKDDPVFERPPGSIPFATCGLFDLTGALKSASLSTSAPGLTVAHWRERVNLRAELPFAPDLPHFDDQRLACRAVFVRYGLESPSVCLLVRHGVIMKPIPLPAECPRGWLVALASDTIPTDLSELDIVQGEEWQALSLWAQATIESVHRFVGNHLAKTP